MSAVQAHLISWPTGVGLFVGINLLLNSRWGRNVDEMVTDFAVRSWHQIRMRIFAAIIHWIVEFFHQALELMERVLYTVDEWLRFRSGESQLATAVKSVLGVVWFFVHYVVRFCITLLIEPQINPIKHFPVVTVSHKLIIPLYPFFLELLTPHLGSAKAHTIVWSTIWLIPGVFGFLVWELRENWRLYAANRSPTLRPATVGRHGESMIRLLRPAFHSGTIPKLFARLRRADRKAHATGVWRKARKFHEKLDETRESVQRFVDRVLIAILELSPAWKGLHVRAEGVRMGITSLRLPVYVDSLGEEPLVIMLQEKAGWLTAHLERPAWFERLSPQQIHAWTAALSGFYAMSGVDLVREQVDACFEPNVPRYDLREQGLVVWPEPHGDLEVIYNLRENAEQSPLVTPSRPVLCRPSIGTGWFSRARRFAGRIGSISGNVKVVVPPLWPMVKAKIDSEAAIRKSALHLRPCDFRFLRSQFRLAYRSTSSSSNATSGNRICSLRMCSSSVCNSADNCSHRKSNVAWS